MLICGQNEMDLHPFPCVAPASAGQPAQLHGELWEGRCCLHSSSMLSYPQQLKIYIFSTKSEVLIQ